MLQTTVCYVRINQSVEMLAIETLYSFILHLCTYTDLKMTFYVCFSRYMNDRNVFSHEFVH